MRGTPHEKKTSTISIRVPAHTRTIIRNWAKRLQDLAPYAKITEADAARDLLEAGIKAKLMAARRAPE